MKINSLDKLKHVDLEVLEVQKGWQNARNLSIQVHLCDFKGCSEAWVEQKELENFIKALSELEQKRIGRALLESQSPGRLKLSVSSIDSLGHMLFEISITKSIFESFGKTVDHRVEGGFELDPTELPNIVAEFKSLSVKR